MQENQGFMYQGHPRTILVFLFLSLDFLSMILLLHFSLLVEGFCMVFAWSLRQNSLERQDMGPMMGKDLKQQKEAEALTAAQKKLGFWKRGRHLTRFNEIVCIMFVGLNLFFPVLKVREFVGPIRSTKPYCFEFLSGGANWMFQCVCWGDIFWSDCLLRCPCRLATVLSPESLLGAFSSRAFQKKDDVWSYWGKAVWKVSCSQDLDPVCLRLKEAEEQKKNPEWKKIWRRAEWAKARSFCSLIGEVWGACIFFTSPSQWLQWFLHVRFSLC